MKNKRGTWRDALRMEFGIHFKNRPEELKFLEAFVNELLEEEKKKLAEEMAKQLHEWYLEACQRPESGMDFNPAAQEPYEALKETQKFLDRYIAAKVLVLLEEEKKIIQEAAIKNYLGTEEGKVYQDYEELKLMARKEEKKKAIEIIEKKKETAFNRNDFREIGEDVFALLSEIQGEIRNSINN
jgi:hypothetical protein